MKKADTAFQGYLCAIGNMNLNDEQKKLLTKARSDYYENMIDYFPKIDGMVCPENMGLLSMIQAMSYDLIALMEVFKHEYQKDDLLPLQGHSTEIEELHSIAGDILNQIVNMLQKGSGIEINAFND